MQKETWLIIILEDQVSKALDQVFLKLIYFLKLQLRELTGSLYPLGQIESASLIL